MKKQLSLFIWAVAAFGMAPVMAATNSGYYGASTADLTGTPGTRTRTTVNYEKYETRETGRTYTTRNPAVGVRSNTSANLYYAEPARRAVVTQEPGRATYRVGEASREAIRKYYLAHPFFQPMAGKFGLVVDGSYAQSAYDFGIESSTVLDGLEAAWDMNQLALKLDASYGITDRVSIMAMGRYDSSDYAFDWKDPQFADDAMDDSGLNLYGIGAQWRFVDNAEWIATLSGYYQRQVDVAHDFILDLKGGYKIGRSTLYGLVRGWYVSFDGNAYGNGVVEDDRSMFLAYETDTDSAMYLEGGLGFFSVLAEDWTLGAELVFGNYDWHNQASIKGAFGWQPGDSFALQVYGKAAIYDSADGQNLDLYWMEPGAGYNSLTNVGTAKVSGYSEYSLGVQAIFYF